MHQRILGIDPGTATVGFGVLDCHGRDRYAYVGAGIIRTAATLPMGERLGIIRNDLLALIDQYRPQAVAIEAIFFFKNAKTLVPVAQARGVILEATASCGLPSFEYTPMQVKLNLTGFGRADKKLVQLSLARLLDQTQVIRPDDAADAVAIALCHARMTLSPLGAVQG